MLCITYYFGFVKLPVKRDIVELQPIPNLFIINQKYKSNEIMKSVITTLMADSSNSYRTFKSPEIFSTLAFPIKHHLV